VIKRKLKESQVSSRKGRVKVKSSGPLFDYTFSVSLLSVTEVVVVVVVVVVVLPLFLLGYK
jgi:hypothetical protein